MSESAASEPTYFSKAWHYPDGWTAEQPLGEARS